VKDLDSLYLAILRNFDMVIQLRLQGAPPPMVIAFSLKTRGLALKAQHKLLLGVKGRRRAYH